MKCMGKTKRGLPCRRDAMQDSLFCSWHIKTPQEQKEFPHIGGRANAAKMRGRRWCRCAECGAVHVRKGDKRRKLRKRYLARRLSNRYVTGDTAVGIAEVYRNDSSA